MPKYAPTNTPTDKPNQNIPTIYYEFFQKFLIYACFNSQIELLYYSLIVRFTVVRNVKK